MKYSNFVSETSSKILDVLDELLGNNFVEWMKKDKYVYLSELLKEGERKGLINVDEKLNIRQELAKVELA